MVAVLLSIIACGVSLGTCVAVVRLHALWQATQLQLDRLETELRG